MNKTDYIAETDGLNSMSLAERELKGAPSVFLFSSSVSSTGNDGSSTKIDLEEIDKSATFLQNLKYWNKETGLLSTNNLDNAHFKQIVDMGADAVPYIVNELKKGPTSLVHALDLIFPDVVEYDGYVSLKDACDKWLLILR